MLINLIFSDISDSATGMVYQDLEDQQMEVGPGMVLPLPEADYVFSWMNFIRMGKTGEIFAHPSCKLNLEDLSTLAYLLVNEDITAAQLLFANLLRAPPTMLPSSTLMDQNENYLKSNPFGGRRRRKRGNLVSHEKNGATHQVI